MEAHLETAANLLRLLKRVLTIFSKNVLKSLNNQADFDSAIRRLNGPTEFFDFTSLIGLFKRFVLKIDRLAPARRVPARSDDERS
jgi:hypothetical protein